MRDRHGRRPRASRCSSLVPYFLRGATIRSRPGPLWCHSRFILRFRGRKAPPLRSSVAVPPDRRSHSVLMTGEFEWTANSTADVSCEKSLPIFCGGKSFTVARSPRIRESLHSGCVSSKIARPPAAASRSAGSSIAPMPDRNGNGLRNKSKPQSIERYGPAGPAHQQCARIVAAAHR